MFRLGDDAFKENNELHTMAVYCLTETIKVHLKIYFEEGYENEHEQDMYRKVKLAEVYKLFPDQLVKNMINMGVNTSLFLPKKIAQFMLLLKNQEEETPDLFIEYVLYRMILEHSKWGVDFTTTEVFDKKLQLKKLLRTYAKEELDLDDVKERNKFVKEHSILLTKFTHMLGSKESDYDSLAFWDYDFLFFDEWGFENAIKESAHGMFGQQRGYGLEYTESIFTDVGEEIPRILYKTSV
jgi:hypothetical protein